jgi:hypothetical protein
MRLTRSLALAVTPSLALLTACGHAHQQPLTHARYAVALAAIASSPAVHEAEREFSELAAGRPSKPCPQEAREFADDIDELVERVAKLRPPADAKDLQARFIPPARRTAHLLHAVADDVAAGRVACGDAWNRRAYGLPSTAESERVVQEYATRGYLLPWNSGD